MLADLKKDVLAASDEKRAKSSAWFFKTGKGEYGEGDCFLGLDNPSMRVIAKKYRDISMSDLQHLIKSKFHEHRQIALFILVEKFKRENDKKYIFDFYIRNLKSINNWDLVDLSAPNIVGTYLLDKPRDVLYKLAKSSDLWEKRIAMLSTYTFIRAGDYDDALKIAEILLHDKHDLIHKAVGWMLREVGNKDRAVEEKFLKKHCRTMPRTALRYAIEKFPEDKRKFYMKR